VIFFALNLFDRCFFAPFSDGFIQENRKNVKKNKNVVDKGV